MVTINLYGKKSCQLCEHTKRKLGFFLKKWGYEGQVQVQYWDLETVDGLAEATFNDVFKTPATLVVKDGNHVARWQGEINSRELKICIDGGTVAPAN